MCGIAGWYRRGRGPVEELVVERQCDAITHRGPDDWGLLIDGDFGFGMRRLSILDLAGGHQPITTPDGRFSIVFNGEIYNHRSVRAELVDLGHVFRTQSDTETVLNAFVHWGAGAWPKLEGMFAVAIWDALARELTLARDPLGIKPLYVSEQKGGIAFGSELKTFHGLPDHDFAICDRAVHDFFSFGHVRKPRAIFEGITMLDPGHYAVARAQGAIQRVRYWRPERALSADRSEQEWIESMRSMLLGSVERHMQSDVAVGAFLSGGIDSSAVLAAMTRSGHGRVKAFTIGYPGAAIDETAAAAAIARHLGCEHIVLALDPQKAVDALPAVLDCFDEPFADMAAIPTWYASKLASEHVKVVLCGEGGDELFAGYKRHRNAQIVARHRPFLRGAAPALALIGRIGGKRSLRFNYLRQHSQRLAEFLRVPDGYQQFFAATEISRSAVRTSIYSPDFRARYESADPYARLEQEYFGEETIEGATPLERFLHADLTLNMPSAMLTRLDRASMAHSVEARVPLLSHLLAEWAMTIPEGLKLRGRTGKYLLRQAIAPWLPKEIMNRPKQGFQMPLAQWFRGDFGDFARTCWNDSGAVDLGYLDPAAVESLFRQHRAGEADHGRLLYAIAAFSLWWQRTRSRPALAA